MLTTSSSTLQSGHVTIPSTASAAKVIVASHSGQLAFTGQKSCHGTRPPTTVTRTQIARSGAGAVPLTLPDGALARTATGRRAAFSVRG